MADFSAFVDSLQARVHALVRPLRAQLVLVRWCSVVSPSFLVCRASLRLCM